MNAISLTARSDYAVQGFSSTSSGSCDINNTSSHEVSHEMHIARRMLIPDIPITVMLIGFAIGASAMGWWFALESIVGVYSALFVGHVVVVVGLLLRPYLGRMVFAVLLGLLMWWPAVLNDHIWGDRF